jgi:hypothetical protein
MTTRTARLDRLTSQQTVWSTVCEMVQFCQEHPGYAPTLWGELADYADLAGVNVFRRAQPEDCATTPVYPHAEQTVRIAAAMGGVESVPNMSADFGLATA